MAGLATTIIETEKERARSRGRKFRLRKPTRVLFPRNVEREYRRELARLVESMETVVEDLLLPQIGGIVRQAGIRQDAPFVDLLSGIMRRIRGLIDDGLDRGAEVTARVMGERISVFNRRQVNRSVSRALGVDVFVSEPQLRDMQDAFVAENVSLIKSLPDTTFREIEDLVKRRVNAGDRAETISEDIRNRLGVAKSRADLIARDQVNKFNGALNRVRQTNLGVTHYIWRTSNDERVRASHAAHNGERFAWDDPPPDTGHPGQDIRCRCTAEPDTEGLL